MKKLVLTRLSSDHTCTLGMLSVYDGLQKQAELRTLEPPWYNNATGKSCIPEGKYQVRPRSTQGRGDHLILIDVQGRSFILIHSGNFPADSTGCVLVGMRFSDLDSDGKLDISASREALHILTSLVQEPAMLTIVDA